MLAFPNLVVVSAGAMVVLGYGVPAMSQTSIAESNLDKGTVEETSAFSTVTPSDFDPDRDIPLNPQNSLTSELSDVEETVSFGIPPEIAHETFSDESFSSLSPLSSTVFSLELPQRTLQLPPSAQEIRFSWESDPTPEGSLLAQQEETLGVSDPSPLQKPQRPATPPENPANRLGTIRKPEQEARTPNPPREVAQDNTPTLEPAPFDLPPLEDEMTSPSEDLEFPGEEDAQVDPDEVMEEAAPLLSPPASQAEILPPENLSPSSNPLLFPTQPEEVAVDISQPITLEEAILLARQNNPNFRVAWLNLEKARAGLRQALAARLPNLGTQMSLTQTDSAQSELSNRATGGTLGGGDTTTTAFDATLELTYNLYTGGRRSALIRQAEEQVRFNQLEVERVAHELRLNVTNAYYGVQEANSQVAIEQAAVDNAQQTLRDAELLEQAGLGTRFDVLRAQVDLANSEQALRSASANQQVAQRQLAQVLNIGQRAEVRAADEVERAGEWDLSLEETIVLAYRNRAELEQQLAQREIDEQQRQAALADIRPQVSLFANYNFLGRFDDDFGPADGYALGARLQWTFFDGGAAKASSEQEELDIEIAETNFEQRRNEIRLEVEEAYANLRARDENIQTATVAVQLAEESLRLARLRFQAGVGTQTDVIDAQTEVTRAQNNLLTAIIGYNRALASLQRAVSNLPNNRLFDQP